MNTTVAPPAGGPARGEAGGFAARVRWAAADGWTITRREVLHWMRRPGQLVAGLLFPVMMLLMFGFLFGGSMTVPGGGDYREFLMPGMFAMTMVFGVGETVTAVSHDMARGVTDRFRSMPMAPSAVVVGRCAADMLKSAITLAVLLGCGLLAGWQWHGTGGEAAAAVGLLLLLRFSLVWPGIYVGLVVRGEAAVTAVHTLEFPLGFLSNAFAATATMPLWLGAVADWNPLSSTVAATRELFGNPGWGGETWIAQNALIMAVVWPLAVVAVFFPLCVRRYRDMAR
ncbi:ABC transporter permease [Nocardiopsis sp. NPDC101807]|uniref:ABC transporter permease n=1 Tax=Nocardiopsis sp. NPDC101807 TaxID=3364339 RepID=UPI00382A871D